MIIPSVGRKVWFRLNGAGAGLNIKTNGDQPVDATIVYVHSNTAINIAGFDHEGTPFKATLVPIIDSVRGDPKPTAGIYCEWMPYQVGQAKSSADDNAKVATARKFGDRLDIGGPREGGPVADQVNKRSEDS